MNFIQTAGAIGGIAASLIRVPTEVDISYFHFNCPSSTFPFSFLTLSTSQVVKQRMQTGQFTSAPDAVRLIVSKEGFKGFYAVCGPHQLPSPSLHSIFIFEIERLTHFNSREEFIFLLFLPIKKIFFFYSWLKVERGLSRRGWACVVDYALHVASMCDPHAIC